MAPSRRRWFGSTCRRKRQNQTVQRCRRYGRSDLVLAAEGRVQEACRSARIEPNLQMKIVRRRAVVGDEVHGRTKQECCVRGARIVGRSGIAELADSRP